MKQMIGVIPSRRSVPIDDGDQSATANETLPLAGIDHEQPQNTATASKIVPIKAPTVTDKAIVLAPGR
jgi:hypothetical protein